MAFHHIMAPLWHMDEGKERNKLSCEATDKMLDLTIEIPNSEALAKAIGGMLKTCASNNKDIQLAFQKVHDAFHQISEQAK